MRRSISEIAVMAATEMKKANGRSTYPLEMNWSGDC